MPSSALLAKVHAADDAGAARAVSLGEGEAVITRGGEWLGGGWLRVLRSGDAHQGALAREREIQSLRADIESLAKKDTATVLDAPALLNAYRDIAAGWMDAKRAQIDALNAVGLSLDEYRWIRHEAYRALGVAYMDLDIARLAEDIKAGRAGQPGEILGSLGPGGPEINRKLIEPIRKKLEQNIALASFGL